MVLSWLIVWMVDHFQETRVVFTIFSVSIDWSRTRVEFLFQQLFVLKKPISFHYLQWPQTKKDSQLVHFSLLIEQGIITKSTRSRPKMTAGANMTRQGKKANEPTTVFANPRSQWLSTEEWESWNFRKTIGVLLNAVLTILRKDSFASLQFDSKEVAILR